MLLFIVNIHTFWICLYMYTSLTISTHSSQAIMLLNFCLRFAILKGYLKVQFVKHGSNFTWKLKNMYTMKRNCVDVVSKLSLDCVAETPRLAC